MLVHENLPVQMYIYLSPIH